MANTERPKAIWPGSGTNKYTFTVFEMGFEFGPNQQGNYIFAKVVNGKWNAVYIGEGDLKERTDAAKKDKCVINKGATHIHAHLNSKEAAFAEETDLLIGSPEAYTPNGCNVKKGG